MNAAKRILKILFSTLFPGRCILCDRLLAEDEHKICNRCNEMYLYPDDYDRKEFFAPLMPFAEDICILAWYYYTEDAIKDFKFGENIYLGKQLSLLLCQRLEKQTWIDDIDCIVPVPLHRKRLTEKGFNQSKVISDVIAKRLGKKVVANNLVRIKNNKSQHTSTQLQRYENTRGIFKLKNPPLFENKNILLVDDVVTTCSTLAECCKAIKLSQGVKIYIACLASDREII